MPSPFPGMDPYLESEDTWHDFHVRCVPALAAVLIKKLPERYIIQADQDVFIREMSAEDRRLVGRPDTFIVDDRPAPLASGAAVAVADRTGASVAAAFPAAAIDVERRPFLQIIDRQRRVVVTAVELLSPSNKSPSGDRAAYLAKRRRLQLGGTNLVEIDLLRGGPRLPLEGLPPCDYYALVSRTADWPAVRLWPIGLRDPLPTIPVPLLAGDADVPLDLRAAMDRAYDDADYARYIYRAEPVPPLSPAGAAWAAERIALIAAR